MEAPPPSEVPEAPASRFRPQSPDQAHDLRLLAAQRRAQGASRLLAGTPTRGARAETRVLAVTSGKGGVGKTNMVVNLAVTLARWGKQVIILDCDLGTANVDVMLGMHARYTLQHVLSRQRRLNEVMSVGPYGVRVISGGSGLQELANLNEARREELLSSFAALEGQADFLLIDTGAGISANVLRFVLAAGDAIIVTTPEPTAITDAYALIKVLSQQARSFYGAPAGSIGGNGVPAGADSTSAGLPMRLRLVVNQATSEAEARETASNITAVAKRFLGVDIEPLGSIPADRNVPQAVRGQAAVVHFAPQSAAARAFEQIATQLVAEQRLNGFNKQVNEQFHGQVQEQFQGQVQAEAAVPTAPRSAGAVAPTTPGAVEPTTMAAGPAGPVTAPEVQAEAAARPASLPFDVLPGPTPAANPSTVGGLRGIGMFVQRMFGNSRGRATS